MGKPSFAVPPASWPLDPAVAYNVFVCGAAGNPAMPRGYSQACIQVTDRSDTQGTIATISCGSAHAAAITHKGHLLTWGSNSQGQCGVDPAQTPEQLDTGGASTRSNTSSRRVVRPARVHATRMGHVLAVACGHEHTVVLTSEGAWSFGSNSHGQLGEGTTSGRLSYQWTPHPIPGLRSHIVTQVVAGRYHTLCLTAQSQVLSWGANSLGQLGLGHTSNEATPQRVPALWGLPITQLAAGDHHSLALTAQGDIYAWGCNHHGQLGIGEPIASNTTPLAAGKKQGENVTRTQAEASTPADGLKATALMNSRGPTDSSNDEADRRVPSWAERVAAVDPEQVAAMTAMGIPRSHAELALVETGCLGVEVATEWLYVLSEPCLAVALAERQSSGRRSGGRDLATRAALGGDVPDGLICDSKQGIPTTEQEDGQRPGAMHQSLEPIRVAGIKRVLRLSAGRHHNAAIVEGGAVYTWGEGGLGALGHGDLLGRDVPTRVQALTGVAVEQVACGGHHTVFVARDGRAYGCGAADEGQLPHPAANAASTHQAQHQLTGIVDSPTCLQLPFKPLTLSQSSDENGTGAGDAGSSHQQGGSSGCMSSDTAPGSSQDARPLHTGSAVTYDVVCGPSTTMFITRSTSDNRPTSEVNLLAKLQAAVARAQSALRAAAAPSHHPGGFSDLAPSLAAVVQGMELLLACPAALNAAFSKRDGSGLDAQLLDSLLLSTLSLTAERQDQQASASTKHHQAHSKHCQQQPPGTSCLHNGSPAQHDQHRDAVVADHQRPHLPRRSSRGGHAADAADDACHRPSSSAGHRPSSSFSHTARQHQQEDVGFSAPDYTGAGSSGAEPGHTGHDGGPEALDVLHQYNMSDAMARCTAALLDDLSSHLELLGTHERALLLLAAAQLPILGHPGHGSHLLGSLCCTILEAPEPAQQLLVHWWSAYPPSLLQDRVIQPMQDFLTRELLATKKLTTSIMHVIKVLALVVQANQIGGLLPPEAFYNKLISEKMDVQDHYTAWRHAQDPGQREQGTHHPSDVPVSRAVRGRASEPGVPLPHSSSSSSSSRGVRRSAASSRSSCGQDQAPRGQEGGQESAGRLGAAAGGNDIHAGGRDQSRRQVDGGDRRPEGGRRVTIHGDVQQDRSRMHTSASAGTLGCPPHSTSAAPPPPARMSHPGRPPLPRSSSSSTNAKVVTNTAPFSFCSYPFLLDARAKSNLLHLEARFQMEQTVAHARMEQQLYGSGSRSRTSGGGTTAAAGGSAVLSRGPSGHNLGHQPSWASECVLSKAGLGVSDASSAGTSVAPITATQQASPPQGNTQAGKKRGPTLLGLVAALLRGRSGREARRMSSDVELSDTGDDTAPVNDQGTAASAPDNDSLRLPPPSACSVPAVHSDMCILRVRRTHLAQDALEEVARQTRRNLLKPLRVHFIGEDGIDAGGVKKEFFQLVVGELLDPSYGLMVPQDESNTLWFPAHALEPPERYKFLGLVLGLAVYNRVLLDFPMPLAVYKKLLGQPVGLRELEEMQPTLGRSLRALLSFEGPGSLEDTLCLSWVVDEEVYGAHKTVELVPGGAELPVTEADVQGYVDAVVDYHLTRSVSWQFEAFAHGFRTLCDGPALQLLNPQELERLVCGSPGLDFGALQANAKYEAGFTPTTPVITWLWDIVRHELPPDEQRRYLKFFTGSDRAPIGGLGTLRCLIQRDGPHSSKLPTSHTCFNTLLLPEYDTRDTLVRQLRTAINNSEGFGLE